MLQNYKNIKVFGRGIYIISSLNGVEFIGRDISNVGYSGFVYFRLIKNGF